MNVNTTYVDSITLMMKSLFTHLGHTEEDLDQEVGPENEGNVLGLEVGQEKEERKVDLEVEINLDGQGQENEKGQGHETEGDQGHEREGGQEVEIVIEKTETMKEIEKGIRIMEDREDPDPGKKIESKSKSFNTMQF